MYHVEGEGVKRLTHGTASLAIRKEAIYTLRARVARGVAKSMPRGRRGEPRQVLGGRSEAYASRHAGDAEHKRAPEWSESCAAVVWSALGTCCTASHRGKEGVEGAAGDVLGRAAARGRLVQACKSRLGLSDQTLLAAILEHHGRKWVHGNGESARWRAVRTFLKPLRERASRRREVRPLDVVPVAGQMGSLQQWLSTDPSQDCARDIRGSARITGGLARWPLTWLTRPGVVVYERAAGRIRDERNGRVDEGFVKGLVKFDVLATAVANQSDHYVIVAPNEPARFMTVDELTRAFGIPPWSSLSGVLLAKRDRVVTANQAAAGLGRGVHVGVATRLLESLVERGLLRGHVRYASMFSGFDTFAVAMERALGLRWEYVFASERDTIARGALMAAWGSRGLAEGRCYTDACDRSVASEGPVDLVFYSPTCEPHSRRNHLRSCDGERVSLGEMWASLAYVRQQRPGIVIVENVTDVSVVGPLTGMLSRLEGYTVELGVLDPRWVAKSPMARERAYWVLTRDDN